MVDSDPDDSPIEEVLAAARPPESPAAVLARARIAGQLFGEVAAGLGRFRVLERLGGGGMGVVYAAYDPQLDRGVALKTVKVPQGGRELALREAKALARLSHPNVVPVFDVGIEDGQVYIVMELVRGTTLREWVKDQAPAAILDVYRQAAQALSAAHGSGLVHRDFKPDNAIVGLDGRVRVVDFGLACETATASTGRGAGTPKYMAPEQAAGRPVSPAADQYSFSVALAEALPAPRPRWIEELVARGSAEEPGERFGSMQELLRALARDPVRLRRRRVLASGVGLGLAGVAAVAYLLGSTRTQPEICDGGGDELAAAWAPDARTAQLARLATLSTYGRDLAPQLARQLDEHRTRWIADHRDACMAHRRGAQSDALLDRRMACLDRSRAALAALAEIVAAADAPALPDVARAVRAIPDPDACADVTALAAVVEPPPPAAVASITAERRTLESARVQIAAGHFTDARTLGIAAVGAARTLAYRPLLAEALLVEGHARMAMDDHATASARLGEAATVAFACGATAIGIEAWARRAWLEGTSDRPANALAGVEIVEALATGTRAPFARALLSNNIGSVELALGHRTAARTAFERALGEARAVTGPGAVELVAIRSNMTFVVDDLAQRDALFVAAHADLARLLGADHPDTLFIRYVHATSTIQAMSTAAQVLTDVCTRHAVHVTRAARTSECWLEVADLQLELGDRAGAVAAFERAQRGADASETPELAGYVALARGDLPDAERQFASALAQLPIEPNEPWFLTYGRAKLQLGLGRARASRPADARAALEPAVAAFATIAHDHPAVAVDRRLGRARAELARALAPMNADPATMAKVATMATLALDWLTSAGGTAPDRAELERLVERFRTGSPTRPERGTPSR